MAAVFAAARRASKDHLVLGGTIVFCAQHPDTYRLFLMGSGGLRNVPALQVRQSTALQQQASPRFLARGRVWAHRLAARLAALVDHSTPASQWHRLARLRWGGGCDRRRPTIGSCETTSA